MLDSLDHPVKVGPWLALTVFLLAIVGLPIYLWRSRGPRGLWLMLPALGLLVAYVTICAVVDEMVYRSMYA